MGETTINRLPDILAPAILLVGVIALGTAFTAQYIFGLDPCVLCLYQRIPYAVAAGLGIWVMLLPGARLEAVAVIAGLLFVSGGVLAVYHVGVEQHWWQAATACGATGEHLDDLRSVSDLRGALFAKAPVPCDAVAWSLFGLSMAAYNAIASWGLAVLSFVAARLIAQKGIA